MSQMDVIVLIGRIAFVLIFLVSGVGHLVQRDQMTRYAQSMGVPSPDILVPATGIQMLVGAVMVLFGIWADLGMILLIGFLLPAAVLMHPFWNMQDPRDQAILQAAFMKNLSMAGAAFALFGLIAYAGSDLGLTLTGPFFSFG
jgi:putative oxidoreductase